MSGCTCSGDRWPDESLVVTVGCRVHHRMPDGCVAADHEVSCEGCMEFFCDHDCAWYDDIDPDGDGGETYLCPECAEYSLRHGTVRPKGAAPRAAGRPPIDQNEGQSGEGDG